MAALPKSVREAGKRQDQYVQAILSKRLNKGFIEGREDFIDSMIRHRGGKDGLTDAEMVSNASILVIAGSETTATLLSGVTFWLLRAPSALQKVVDEVRSSFHAEDDITFQTATSRLPYMLACFNEALRLYPPVPTGLQRVTLPGQMTRISDYDIPPKTKVTVSQLAAYTTPMNFQDADKIIPERWLPDAKDDSTSLYYDDSREVIQPFSMGPRNCLGRHLAYNEMRLILARILWNFDIQLCEESQNWNDQRIYTLWDKPPMMCQLKDRLAQS